MSTVEHSADFQISQRIEVLFPLFSAEGEKLWVPGWDYENIMGSRDLHEDYVFLTKNHDHAATDAIWIVKQYKPEAYFVQFYKIEPEEKVGIVTVQCNKLNNSLTQVEVTYKYIGLSKMGDEFIERFTSDEYKAFIDQWHNLLVTYFESNGN
jgi:hypothetical protein